MEFEKLISQNETQRDEQWEMDFLKKFTEQNLSLSSQDPQTGPDGWPYLLVKTGKGTEPCLKLLEWLSERGIGMVLNVHKQLPDYVFTYGMIWGYREYGKFLSIDDNTPSLQVEFKEGAEPLMGAPSEQYLPEYVRVILRQFFKDQELEKVKVLVVHEEEQTDLYFSLESLGNPQESEHEGVAEAISWFLPVNYSIVFTAEENFSQFYDL